MQVYGSVVGRRNRGIEEELNLSYQLCFEAYTKIYA